MPEARAIHPEDVTKSVLSRTAETVLGLLSLRLKTLCPVSLSRRRSNSS